MSKSWKDRKKELKEPDQFVQQGTSFMEVLVKNRKFIVPGIGGVLVIALGIYASQWWSAKKLNNLWGDYYRAQRVEGDAKLAGLEKFFNENSKWRPVVQAAIDLGDHHFDKAKGSEKADERKASAKLAADWYSKALDGDLAEMERQLLLINRGRALEMNDQYDEALTQLEEASKIEGKGKAFAVLSQGWVHELKGDREKAIEFYQKVQTDFSDSEYARLAKSYALSLKASND